MWECESCGTQGIAGDLVRCPGCGADRRRSASETATPPDETSAEKPETADASAAQTGIPVFVGEQGPELWDKTKSLADNLAATPEHAESDAQDDAGGA